MRLVWAATLRAVADAVDAVVRAILSVGACPYGSFLGDHFGTADSAYKRPYVRRQCGSADKRSGQTGGRAGRARHLGEAGPLALALGCPKLRFRSGNAGARRRPPAASQEPPVAAL